MKLSSLYLKKLFFILMLVINFDSTPYNSIYKKCKDFSVITKTLLSIIIYYKSVFVFILQIILCWTYWSNNFDYEILSMLINMLNIDLNKIFLHKCNFLVLIVVKKKYLRKISSIYTTVLFDITSTQIRSITRTTTKMSDINEKNNDIKNYNKDILLKKNNLNQDVNEIFNQESICVNN